MSQNFFDRLSQTEQLLKDELPEARSENYDLSLKTIGILRQFVFSCAWSDTEKTRQMMRNIHRRAVDAAEICKVSPHTVRSARSQASKKLFQMFGEDVFEKIIVGGKETCRKTMVLIEAIHQGYDRVENFIPDSLLRKLESQQSCGNAKYEPKELGDVLLFLGRFDLIAMQRQLATLDQDKLMYVFEILNNDLVSADSEHRVNHLKLYILRQIMRYR